MYNLVWEHTSFSSILATVISVVCISIFWKYWNMKTCVPSPVLKPADIKNAVEEEMKILEEKIKTKQLEEIYKFMQEHSDQFGTTTRDDMQDLIKLYGY